jgi:hypothetical protein
MRPAPPPTDIPALRLTIMLVAGSWFALALAGAAWMLRHLNGWLGIVVLGLAVLGLGLWRLQPLARHISVVLLWLIVALALLGSVNPFRAEQFLAAGTMPPPAWQLLLPVLPLVLAALLALHVLGRYRAAFERT